MNVSVLSFSIVQVVCSAMQASSVFSALRIVVNCIKDPVIISRLLADFKLAG